MKYRLSFAAHYEEFAILFEIVESFKNYRTARAYGKYTIERLLVTEKGIELQFDAFYHELRCPSRVPTIANIKFLRLSNEEYLQIQVYTSNYDDDYKQLQITDVEFFKAMLSSYDIYDVKEFNFDVTLLGVRTVK